MRGCLCVIQNSLLWPLFLFLCDEIPAEKLSIENGQTPRNIDFPSALYNVCDRQFDLYDFQGGTFVCRKSLDKIKPHILMCSDDSSQESLEPRADELALLLGPCGSQTTLCDRTNVRFPKGQVILFSLDEAYLHNWTRFGSMPMDHWCHRIQLAPNEHFILSFNRRHLTRNDLWSIMFALTFII